MDPQIARAVEVLRRGGLVAFPTETVYGLGADAFNPRACARVFEVKGRPRFDPLIVHLAEPEQLREVGAAVPRRARELTARFWPGPLTLVLPKARAVPEIVTAGLPTVAVRLPAHELARALIRALGRPVAAPSANRFGGLSPTTAAHVRAQLGEAVDFVLDGGPCPVGVESTIVDLTQEPPRLLRPGGTPLEALEAILGPLERQTHASRPSAPGQLPRHYAPRTPLRLVRDPVPRPGERAGLLAFRAAPPAGRFAAVEVLSPRGDLREAAARLFACLHRLDEAGLEVIYAEPVPETGLGRAILDRLRRAARPPTPETP